MSTRAFARALWSCDATDVLAVIKGALQAQALGYPPAVDPFTGPIDGDPWLRYA